MTNAGKGTETPVITPMKYRNMQRFELEPRRNIAKFCSATEACEKEQRIFPCRAPSGA